MLIATNARLKSGSYVAKAALVAAIMLAGCTTGSGPSSSTPPEDEQASVAFDWYAQIEKCEAQPELIDCQVECERRSDRSWCDEDKE